MEVLKASCKIFVRRNVTSSVSVSVYYEAVRTIVLSRHGSNLARPVIIHGLIYVPSTPCCGFVGVSPDGNCAYVHWGSFMSNSKSVRRAIWFTWFSEPHECIQHLAVPGGPRRSPIQLWPGATLLNFSDRAQTVERTPYSICTDISLLVTMLNIICQKVILCSKYTRNKHVLA